MIHMSLSHTRMTHWTQNLHEAIESIEVENEVCRGFLDLPPNLIVKILSSIPVKERVRVSRTCMAFYDVLSGPHAFSDVKEIPGPEIQFEQFTKIIDSEKDNNTRSAMAKRLHSSVTSLDLSEFWILNFGVKLKVHKLNEQLMFASALQNLTKLSITFIRNVISKEFDLTSLQVLPHKLHISSLSVRVRCESLATVLNGLERILDFSAVRFVSVYIEDEGLDTWFDLSPLLEHDLKNLETLDLDVNHGACASGVLGVLLMKNVESLKHVYLGYSGKTQICDQSMFLYALGQLHLQHLKLFIAPFVHDRWLTDLAESSGNTLARLSFRPASDHALDFIQQQWFKKLTKISLKYIPQSLTSVIALIEGRPAGLPKIRLKCAVERQDHETEEQKEVLRKLISSESDAFVFVVTILDDPDSDSD